MGADLESAEKFPPLYENLAQCLMATSLVLQLERCNLRICKTFKQAPAFDCDALG